MTFFPFNESSAYRQLLASEKALSFIVDIAEVEDIFTPLLCTRLERLSF